MRSFRIHSFTCPKCAIFYSELLAFVQKNNFNIINFEQIDDSSITFNIRIEDKDYMVIKRRYIFDQLLISAKAL